MSDELITTKGQNYLHRKSIFDEALASSMSILYGGSCKASNAKALFSQPDVDGGLIGGAALKAETFLPIIAANK